MGVENSEPRPGWRRVIVLLGVFNFMCYIFTYNGTEGTHRYYFAQVGKYHSLPPFLCHSSLYMYLLVLHRSKRSLHLSLPAIKTHFLLYETFPVLLLFSLSGQVWVDRAGDVDLLV